MYSEFLWFIVYTFDHLAVGTTNPNVFYDCHITLTTYRVSVLIVSTYLGFIFYYYYYSVGCC